MAPKGLLQQFEPGEECEVPRWLTEAALLLQTAQSTADFLVEGDVLRVHLLSVQQGLLLMPEGLMFRHLRADFA